MPSQDMPRNYNAEAADHVDHAYAFAFDYVMHDFMLRSFKPDFAEGGALELGCYHGNFTRLLCAQFASVDVVEASSECIGKAKELVGARARFHHGRFEEFEPVNPFANIFLIHTLEHLDDRVGMLKRISNWLVPGGRLFVATPNAYAGSRQIAVAMGLIEEPTAITPAEHAHGHKVTYSLDTLAADTVAAELAITGRGGIFFKGLANFQIDKAMAAEIISTQYLEGAYTVGFKYPELCSSVYVVCTSK